METITPKQKEPFMKGLALAGLVAVIIFLAWISIQIVQVFPAALNSLASLANSVYNYNPAQIKDIDVKNDKSVIASGEVVILSWPIHQVPGVYTLSYECTPLVTMSIITKENKVMSIGCDESYEIGNTESVSMTINSKASQIVNVPYSVSFFRTNASTPTAKYVGSITLTNPDLSSLDEETIATSTKPELIIVPELPVIETVIIIEEEPEIAPVAPAPAVSKPTTPAAPEPTYIYKIPTSNPKGSVDLAVTYIAVGSVNSQGKFTKTSALTKNMNGAIQYGVHNIGNKTSESWKFITTLSGGIKYTSSTQNPLKPNERAVLTLQFGKVSDTGTTEIKFLVETKTDKNTNNNIYTDKLKVAR